MAKPGTIAPERPGPPGEEEDGVKIVLGIGNPGREYEGTRHNVGYRVLDRVAAALGAEIRRRKVRGRVGDG